MHANLLYHLGKLCIPRDESVNVIRKSHTSLIFGHFKVGKTIAHLQMYCYWPKMNETISKNIKGCVMCAKSKPSNRKLGLYKPLSIPSQPWESISMECVGGFQHPRQFMIIYMYWWTDLSICVF